MEAGADALSAVNTYVGMTLDLHTGRPVLANVTGGLSGPAIRPLALHAVYTVSRAVKVPVIASGGVMSGRTRSSSCWPARSRCRSGPSTSCGRTPGSHVLSGGSRRTCNRRGLGGLAELRPAAVPAAMAVAGE